MGERADGNAALNRVEVHDLGIFALIQQDERERRMERRNVDGNRDRPAQHLRYLGVIVCVIGVAGYYASKTEGGF